jgi:hypothetical protein
VFIERKIMGRIHGAPVFDLQAYEGWNVRGLAVCVHPPDG